MSICIASRLRHYQMNERRVAAVADPRFTNSQKRGVKLRSIVRTL